ncbi:MAG: hypothetical protein AB7E26_05035 [Chryseobacterium sp.]
MSPLPELNLNLGISNKQDFPFYDGGEKGVMIRADSGLRKHTVSLMISDKEAGEIIMKIGEKEITVPTYKLTITDNKTEETKAYQVIRDTLSFARTKTRKSFLSFFGFRRFDRTSYLYNTIAFEPLLEDMQKFDISRHRRLSQDMLIYEFESNDEKLLLFAGDINAFAKPEHIDKYFMLVDKDNGKSFIGDILYREKFLKLTPVVELTIIKRKKVPKNFEYDDIGSLKKLIYL